MDEILKSSKMLSISLLATYELFSKRGALANVIILALVAFWVQIQILYLKGHLLLPYSARTKQAIHEKIERLGMTGGRF